MKFTDNCPRIIRTNDKPAKVKLDYVRARTDTVTIAGNEYTYYIQKCPGGYALNINGYIMNIINGNLQNAIDFCEEFFQEIKDGATSPIMDKHYKYKQFIKDYDISAELLNYLRENDNQATLQAYSIKRACVWRRINERANSL